MGETYMANDYREVTATKKMESLWIDSMEQFGWKFHSSTPKTVKRLPAALWIAAAPLSLLPWQPFRKRLTNHDSGREVVLQFTRDKKIGDCQELKQLQSRFECCMRAVGGLEESKTTGAALISVLIGLAGTALMALSVFLYMAGAFPLFVVAAVPGFIGWILPFFVYRKMKADNSRKADEKIEEQQEQIYEICRLASAARSGRVA